MSTMGSVYAEQNFTIKLFKDVVLSQALKNSNLGVS